MSQAKASFESALGDVTNLLQFHEDIGGKGRGKRPDDLSSLNKSAIVLLCAAWEAYIEFVAIECAEKNIRAASTPSSMRKSIFKLVSNYIRTDKDESVWHKVAGVGWRTVANSVIQAKVNDLNTPKTKHISRLFQLVLDVQKIEDNWTWHKSVLGVAERRLDEFVTLRGSIAHGERQVSNITKIQVTTAQDLVRRLVDKVEDRLTREALL